MTETELILCGMYAFSERLRNAWRSLFARLEIHPAGGEPLAFELGFDLIDLPRRERLLCAHTCGYPLVKTLADAYAPFCVPVFDVDGADGRLYSSRLVVPAGAGFETLADCSGGTVAINGYDSNSGMNLLRYELARAGARPGFFGAVKVTGGHLQSLEAVAAGEAQLAAIDCISYRLIADERPELAAAVDSLGFTTECSGLPFVLARERDTPELRAALLKGLRRALARSPQRVRACLHLAAFEAVDDADYAPLLELENKAISMGYAEVN